MTEEHDASRIWSHVLTWGLLALFASGVLVKTVPLTSHRPPESSPASLTPTGRQDVEARLWDDPFVVMRDLSAKTAEDRCKLALADPAHHPATLTRSSRRLIERWKSTVTVMAVMVPTGPYFEDAEARRRYRYAVVQGLLQSEWYPFEGDKLGFVWTLESCIENPWQRRAPEIVPYEWFCKKGDCRHSEALLVLWTDEDALTRRPLEGMETLLARLSDPDATCPKTNVPSVPFAVFSHRNETVRSAAERRPASGVSTHAAPSEPFAALANRNETVLSAVARMPASGAPAHAGFCSPAFGACYHDPTYSEAPWHRTVVLGPMLSATLEALVRELGTAETGRPGPPPEWLRFYSSGATAADPDVGLGKSGTQGGNESIARRLVRLTATDDRLTDALVNELRLRLVSPSWGGERSTSSNRLCNGVVALITEGDTSYARSFQKGFAARAGCGTQHRILNFQYLRGLDGAAPRSSAKADSPAKQSDERPPALSIGSLLESAPPERAEGSRQFDYLTRIADELVAEDVRNRDKRGEGGERGEGVVAIGILGSDVYDKLLVLEAVKPRFRDAVFFTSDLDMRLVDASREGRAARNLVVASPYGLQLAPPLQGAAPPFRDSYQTGLYFATRLSLQDAPRAWPAQETLADWFEEVRRFEIGRTRAVALGGCPTRAMCTEFARVAAITSGDGNGKGPVARMAASVADSFRCPAEPRLPKPCTLHAEDEGSRAPIRLLALHWQEALLAASSAFLLMWLGSGRFRRAFQPWRKSVLRLAGALLVLALGFAGAMVLGDDARSTDGEPLAWAEGVSMWPTQMIRVGTIGLILLLLWFGRARFEAGLERIPCFGAGALKRAAQAVPFRWSPKWLWWWPPPSAAKGKHTTRICDRYLVRLFRRAYAVIVAAPAALFAVLKRAAQAVRKWLWWCAPASAAQGKLIACQGKDTHRIWDHYLARMSRRACTVRAGVSAALFAVLVFSLLAFDWPNSPHRGWFSAVVNEVLFVSVVLAFAFLLFATLDAQAMTRRFLKRVALEEEIRWPQALVDELERRYPIEECFLIRLARFQVAMEVAAVVSRFIWLPFLALPLVFVARSTVFDAWDFPLPYILLMVLVTALAIGGAYQIRSAARAMRERLLENLRDSVRARELKHFSTRKLDHEKQAQSGEVPRVAHTADLPAALATEWLQRAQSEVAGWHNGPLRPFSQEPAVRAVLAFLGTGGLAAIVEAFVK